MIPTAQLFMYLLIYLFQFLSFLAVFYILLRILAVPIHWFVDSFTGLMSRE